MLCCYDEWFIIVLRDAMHQRLQQFTQSFLLAAPGLSPYLCDPVIPIHFLPRQTDR